MARDISQIQTCVIAGEMTLYMDGAEPKVAPEGSCYWMPPGRRMSGVNTAVNSSQITVSTVSVNGSVRVGNSTQNVVINTTGISINNQLLSVPTLINVQTSGTGSQVVDYFPLTTFRGAEYTISITDNGANAYQMSKVLIIHDTGNSQITDYGLLYTNGQLGIFTTTVNATSCILAISPYVSSTQVKATRTLIDI